MGAFRMRGTVWMAFAVVCVAGLTGCYINYPHVFPTIAADKVVRTHSKPMEGGYYQDFDPDAASIELTPVKSVNPVGTQHVLIATVRDKSGEMINRRRVEWIILEGSVGDIVEVDESGWLVDRGHKVNSHYAITHTNDYDHILTRGNSDPSDDVVLKKGQTWITITSGFEGTTRVCAYAPGIFDWDKHKVFADKHWYDVKWQFPPAATNPVDTPHPLTTKVMKYSNDDPLQGYDVTYRIVDGPPAALEPGGGQTATVKTDAQGLATATLRQARPAEGTNRIAITIVRPKDLCKCTEATQLATGATTKTWIGPKIGISKTAPATAKAGETFRYNIAVNNPSRVAAKQVVVTDVLPAGISYVESSPSAQVQGQSLTWSLGTLGAGARKAITVMVKGNRTGKFDNCASVTAAYGLSARDCASTVIVAPKLALQKTGPAEVLICDPITYKIVVRNTGDGPATNVRVRDALPAGLVTTDGQSTVGFDAGTLAAGQAKEATFQVKAKKRGTYVNRASATADGGLSAAASAKTVVREPVLVITKAGPKVRFVRRKATYTITVANKGDGDAPSAKLVDTLPAGTRFVSASQGGAHMNGKVTWDLGTLKVNQSRTVSVTVMPEQMGTIRNTVTATAHCATASAQVTTLVKGIPAILLEVVDVGDPIEVGSNITYDIIVTNQGSAVGTNIVIEVTLPPQETYVSATGPTKAVVAGKVTKFAPLPSLAPKARAVYKVVAKGTQVGDVRFRVELTSDQMTSPVNESESTNIYR